MARDLNSVVIVGRLTRDPEVKYTPNGQALAKMSIANNTSYTQNNELKEYVNYFDITVWGNQAVNCQKYLRKGSQVIVQGRLRQDRWEDKTTGKTVSKVEILADNIQFLGSASGNGGQNSQFGNQNGYQNPQQNMQPQNNYSNNQNMGNPYQNAAPVQNRPQQNNNLNPWADDNGSSNDFYGDTFNQGGQGMPDGGYAGSDDDIPF